MVFDPKDVLSRLVAIQFDQRGLPGWVRSFVSDQSDPHGMNLAQRSAKRALSSSVWAMPSS